MGVAVFDVIDRLDDVDGDDLRARYAARLAAVRGRVDAACRAAGRAPGEVTVIAVSKTHDAEHVRALYELGHRDFGENKYQELADKAARLTDLADLRWHFIGQLQRNKAAKASAVAHAMHSVDRLPLIEPLARAAAGRAEPLGIYLQLSVDGDATRGGGSAEEVMRCAEAVAASPALRLRGLMAVAPPSMTAPAAFAVVADVAAELRRRHPDAVELSAGMSHDLEDAVAAGATNVRIGTALFGGRIYT